MYWFHSPNAFYIAWLSNILALGVPDECYSSNVPDEGYSSNVPDEGYSRNTSCALSLISTFLLMIINHISTSENMSVQVVC